MFIEPLTPIKSLCALMLLACFSGAVGEARAFTCDKADYDLRTQSSVDALLATGCTTITGNLYIGNTSSSSNITNLNGLANITSIGGLLSIRNNPSLTNTDGLGSLAAVSGAYVTIQDNDSLTGLDGLSSLTEVQGDLAIRYNDALTNLDGLSGLETVGGNLNIWDSASLTSINGLTNLVSIGGNLSVLRNENPAFTDLDGLSALTTIQGALILETLELSDLSGLSNVNQIAGSFLINDIWSLNNIDGLAALTAVGGDLKITSTGLLQLDGLSSLVSVGGLVRLHTNSLANLDGLQNLVSVGGSVVIAYNQIDDVDGLRGLTQLPDSLTIENNDELQNVDGLAGLESIGGYLSVSNNVALSDCEALALVLGYPNGENSAAGSASENASGCNSVEEVYASVVKPSLPVVTSVSPGNRAATVFFDPPTTQSELFPVVGYGTYCSGNIRSDDLTFPEGSEQLIPSTGTSRSFITISEFAPTTAESSLIIKYIIEHERPDLLTVTLVAPSGNRYVLRSNSLAPETKFGEYFRVDPAEIEQSYDDGTDYYYGTAPGDISGLKRELIDGVWELEIFNEGGPLPREGKIYEFSVSVRETPAVASTASPVTLTNLINDRQYQGCFVDPKTRFGIEFEVGGDSFSVTPTGTAPANVKISDVEFEDGRLSVYVTVGDDGGYPIETYRVACDGDDGSSLLGSSESSPIFLAGAREGVSYICRANASNSRGETSSPASPPFTAEELYQQGLPTWLLYEASK